ncbi:MAG: hypothetical protein R2861_11080 [Desulfobacterales bacterium]
MFCKSDCTHATNKGIPKSKVTAGLCVMMSNKILELLKKRDRKNIMVTGGTALNWMMINNLKAEIPGLIVPEEAPYFEVMGTALWALDHQTHCFPEKTRFSGQRLSLLIAASPLRTLRTRWNLNPLKQTQQKNGDHCILGLMGSITTKAVLLAEEMTMPCWCPSTLVDQRRPGRRIPEVLRIHP